MKPQVESLKNFIVSNASMWKISRSTWSVQFRQFVSRGTLLLQLRKGLILRRSNRSSLKFHAFLDKMDAGSIRLPHQSHFSSSDERNSKEKASESKS